MRLEATVAQVIITEFNNPSVRFEANPSAPAEYWPKDCPITHAQVNSKANVYPYIVTVTAVTVGREQAAWTDHTWTVTLENGKPKLSETVYSIGD